MTSQTHEPDPHRPATPYEFPVTADTCQGMIPKPDPMRVALCKILDLLNITPPEGLEA